MAHDWPDNLNIIFDEDNYKKIYVNFVYVSPQNKYSNIRLQSMRDWFNDRLAISWQDGRLRPRT